MVDYFGDAARLRQERRARIRAQRRALPVPALGPVGLPQFPRRAARHRHLPPGQSRISRRRPCGRARRTAARVAYPDTLVGTDSHTTMVNGLAVLGWGVGGIEAEAAMLGQPISMLIPEVIGFRLTGRLTRGRHRHRPRAHRHRDAAQEGRGRQVRRVLRRRPRPPVARGPGDHRQHGAGIWRHLRLLPGRQARPSPISRTTGRDPDAHRAGRGLCQGAGHVPRPTTRPIRSSPTRWRSTSPRSCPRSPARSGRRTASLAHRRRASKTALPRIRDSAAELRHGRGRRRLGAKRCRSSGRRGLRARPTATS